MKKLFVVLLLAIGCNTLVFAEDKKAVNIGKLYYYLDDTTQEAEVTRKPTEGRDYDVVKEEYSNSLVGHLDIPSEVYYNGKTFKVTSIGDYAFLSCEKITSVVIPNSVKTLKNSAFSWAKGMTSVVIGNNVKRISSGCFGGCKSLTSVAIPRSVETIDINAFEFCGSLTDITIPSSVKSIGGGAFGHCGKLTSIKGLHAGMDINKDAFKARNYDTGKTPFSFEEYKKTFEWFKDNFVITKIKEWQKKRDFETTVQYRSRVTKENQQKKINDLTKEAIKSYTTENKLKVTLGDYDADYQLYALNSNYGQKYVKIPLAQAPAFKNNFQRATFTATYASTADGLKIDNLTVTINGRRYQAEKTAVEVASNNIDIELPEIILAANSNSQTAATKPAAKPTTEPTVKPTVDVADHTIDLHIPAVAVTNNQTFAVIIGNERYTQVAQVPYANNDARIFAEYCKKTLGLPAQNVRVYENSTYGTMLSAMADIKKIAEAYNGAINVIFYYAGHGIPNEQNRDSYLLPVDADGKQAEVWYPVSRLYKELGSLGAKNVVVFMDACFSGAQRGEGMLASARGVALKAKVEVPQGNMVVFSAATGDETAYPYKEKGHGMFTYFLLKKLQESKGDCTLQELGEYIQTNVKQQSVVINRKSQTPTVVPSADIADSWKTMKLK